MNENLIQFVSKARQMGVQNGNQIIGIPDHSAVAKAIGMSETEVGKIIAGFKKVMAVSPGAAELKEWNDEVWQQCQILVDEILTKAAKPQVSLFGAINGSASAASAQQAPVVTKVTAPAINILTTVKMAARSIKTENRDEYDLFSLNEKNLDKLVSAAQKEFEGKSPTRQQVHDWVKNEMRESMEARELIQKIKDEATRRGWEVAPWPQDRNTPRIPTDRELRVIGNTDFESIKQGILYDGFTLGEAFDGLGFMAHAATAPSAPATTNIGGQMPPGLFGR